MAETWIPWAKRAEPSAGGKDKEGYWGIPNRALDLIEFIINHSAEGWLAYLLNFHRPGEDASWGLIGPRSGGLIQGRPLESIPWTSGGPQNNIRGLAVEWEGVKGQPLTPAQVATARRLFAFLKTVCPNLGPPVFPGGFREHSEMTNGATSCPNGRIQTLYDSYITKGEAMIVIQINGQREVYTYPGRVHIKSIEEYDQMKGIAEQSGTWVHLRLDSGDLIWKGPFTCPNGLPKKCRE